MKDFKEEVGKNSKDTSGILEELRSLMFRHVVEKGKEVGSSSEGGNKVENRVSQSNSVSSKANQAKNKGILGIVFTLYLVNEVTQMLSKIELATFEGKEPRVWLVEEVCGIF